MFALKMHGTFLPAGEPPIKHIELAALLAQMNSVSACKQDGYRYTVLYAYYTDIIQ